MLPIQKTKFLLCLSLAIVCLVSLVKIHAEETSAPFRPPVVPLVVNEPYLSIWSVSDHLADSDTVHWTGYSQPLTSLIRIDGKAYRLMGKSPATCPAFPQVGLQVTPTRSIYDFEDTHVHVKLTFMNPALPDRLDVLARPLTYLTWTVKSRDGQAHDVSIYDSTSSALAVNLSPQSVTWSRKTEGPLTALKCGSIAQTLFQPAGDGVRIDWGYAYAAAPTSQSTSSVGASDALIERFVDNGTLPDQDDTPPRAVSDNQPVMAFVFNLGSVQMETSRHLMIAYDELYQINFSGQKLLPYWKRNGATASSLLQNAEKDYSTLVPLCEGFDRDLMADMTQVGGAQYAQIGALAYRQALAATGLVADADKQPLLFTKENSSNGDIATVDVFFPTSPIFLLLNPTLAKASIVPALVYAASDRWKFPNAPHDLGTYPVASATGAPGEAMPVEESGNMLILCDAIAKVDGNADFVAPWWTQLTQWAKYLENYGLDPQDQLCTDDFMGHLAHNSNLSVKAIIALAAYGDLCHRRGDEVNASKYFDLARADARHWMQAADDGDHYRTAFDKPHTWCLKYNLIWDSVLGLNIFPPEVAQKETAYYKSMMQPFGVPLDSRKTLGDVDHLFFSASYAPQDADFKALIAPFYNYLNETPQRDPMVDTYPTDKLDGKGPRLKARSVVGGIFIKMLTNPGMWKKWAGSDKTKPGPWAPIPPPPPPSEAATPPPKKT
jgi:hypothetical protein